MKSIPRWLLITSCLLALAAGAPALDEYPWAMASKMYGDKKARRIGDIVQVQIVEESSSTKDATKTSDKSYDSSGKLSFFAPQVDGNSQASWTNVTVPAWSIDTKRGFSGKGSMENKDSLTAVISARVMEVLPNGNLLIEGSRMLTIQGESVEFILTGTIRPLDISRDNVVKSTAVADASIRYVSQGTIAKNQQPGILPRLIDWINPF